MIFNPYLIGGTAIAFMLSFATGYYKGYSHEHERFVAFQEQIKLVSKAQETQNESIVKQHQLVTDGIKNEYEAKIAALRSYYSKRVQYNNSGGANLSTVPNASAGTDGNPTDAGFVGRCAETTAQLVSLQQWVNKQLSVK